MVQEIVKTKKFQTRQHPQPWTRPCSVLAPLRDDKKAANESDMVNDGDAAPLGTLGSTRREGQIGE
jgi:hypothetical protein